MNNSNQRRAHIINPVAIVFILFCTAIGALLDSAWGGLAIGTGISLLASMI